jgi:ParB-like chromosome segregation protein Spo0J
MARKSGTDTRPTTASRPGPGKVEVWKLDRLKRHPMQDANFHPLPDRELEALADDMRRNGQRTPIEVTPDGRTIDGHQRKQAAERLGWDEVRVLVRHDLAGDEAAIERRLIEANLNRRQLDALDRVRLARRMQEIDGRKRPGGLSQCDEQDLRDRVGEALGMSGRNVQRYLNILNAPMEVQRAYSGGRVSMKLAEKVARLEGPMQEEIAAEISSGGDPAQVVIAHLPEAAPAEVDPDREYECFLAAAAHAVEVLDGRVARVRGGMHLDRETVTLKRAGSLITGLIARHEQLKKQRAETLRSLAREGFGRS